MTSDAQLIAHHLLTDAQPISKPQPDPFLCYSTSLYTRHEILWHKISIWPVQVSCQSCASSLGHFSLAELGTSLPGWYSCVQITNYWRGLRFLYIRVLWWYRLWFDVRSIRRRNYGYLANLKVEFYSCINKSMCHSHFRGEIGERFYKYLILMQEFKGDARCNYFNCNPKVGFFSINSVGVCIENTSSKARWLLLQAYMCSKLVLNNHVTGTSKYLMHYKHPLGWPKNVLHQLPLPYRNCNRPWLDLLFWYVAWKNHTWNRRSRKRIKEEEYL